MRWWILTYCGSYFAIHVRQTMLCILNMQCFVSPANSKLSLAICFYKDEVTSHCSCWPSTPPGVQGGDQEWGSLCSGKTWKNRSSDCSIFSGDFRSPILESLHTKKSTIILHGDVCYSRLAVMFTRLAAMLCKNVFDCMYFPLHSNYIYTDLPPPLQSGFSELSEMLPPRL